MIIQEVTEQSRKEAEHIRGTIVVSRGKVHMLEQIPGFLVRIDGEIKGLISYHLDNQECEIVSLASLLKNQGIGSKLIELVIAKAREHHCRRVWLITSNDNVKAIRFYQKRGFDLKAVHRDAITEARKLKPSIPLIGDDQIPIRHEVEFEIVL